MAWLLRLMAAVLAVLVVINGGYWETHRHVTVGVLMALLGIASLIIATGAKMHPVETD